LSPKERSSRDDPSRLWIEFGGHAVVLKPVGCARNAYQCVFHAVDPAAKA
jgi:hypothetical protein